MFTLPSLFFPSFPSLSLPLSLYSLSLPVPLSLSLSISLTLSLSLWLSLSLPPSLSLSLSHYLSLPSSLSIILSPLSLFLYLPSLSLAFTPSVSPPPPFAASFCIYSQSYPHCSKPSSSPSISNLLHIHWRTQLIIHVLTSRHFILVIFRYTKSISKNVTMILKEFYWVNITKNFKKLH